MKFLTMFLLALCAASATHAQLITPTGSMNTARGNFSSQLLQNGKVLVMGGDDANSTTYNSAELYNPATGIWTNTGSMHIARTRAASVLLDNGNVLVVAGNTDVTNFIPTASCEIYNVSTGTWSFTDSLTRSDADCHAFRLNTGKILEVSTSIGRSHLYDQSTNKWSLTDSAVATAGSIGSAATLLSNGKVFLCGGNTDTAELYSPATNKWVKINGPMIQPAYSEPTAVQLDNGNVLINIFNTNDEIFDTTTQTFDTVSLTINIHDGDQMISLSNGNALISGVGDIFSANPDNLEIFSPISKQWYTAGTISAGIFLGSNYAMLKLNTGKILVAGGYFGSSAYQYCYLLDEKNMATATNDIVNAQDPLILWPNPTTNNFTLNLNNHNHNQLSIHICGIDGETVYTTTTQADKTWNFNDNAPGIRLAAGVYFVTVTGDNNTLTQKLVIQ